jgi:hypothetical protein
MVLCAICQPATIKSRGIISIYIVIKYLEVIGAQRPELVARQKNSKNCIFILGK